MSEHPFFTPRRVLESLGSGPELRLEGAGYAYTWRSRRAGLAHWPLHDTTVTFRPGVITGLLGRNGAGKSTLLDVAAGLRAPDSGTAALVDVDAEGRPTSAGTAVLTSPVARAAVTILGTRPVLLPGSRVGDMIRLWETTRPLWSTQDAHRYLRLLELAPDARIGRLSQGQRSAVDAAFALASHSPVLLLDQVHLGMDAVVRRRFWDAVLAQYAVERPTIVVAAHELGEIEDLLEDVVVLSAGTVAAAGAADELRAAITPPGAPLADLTDVINHYSASPLSPDPRPAGRRSA